MGKKLYPTDTLEQAQSILRAWKRIDPALKIGTLTLESITADVARVEGLQQKIVHLQYELMDIRIQRDEATIGLWNMVTRTRSGFRGIYGDDSTAYELAGGTRRSERKKPRRRTIQDSPK
jgi:hypothetical protein